MSNAKEFKQKKELCRELYVEQGKSYEDLITLTGVSKRTIEGWIRKESWNDKKFELANLEKQLDTHAKKALVEGLKAYAADPANKDLQSLVSLLKSYKEKTAPSQQYKENVLKFLDSTTDFFLERNMPETAQVWKESIRDLAEYLMNRG